MILVTLFDTGTAAEHVLLAGGLEAKHIEDLSEVIALLLTAKILHFWDGLHINYELLISLEHITEIIIMEHTQQ